MELKETTTPAPSTSDPVVKELAEALAEPFDKGQVKFKPGVVSGSRALALAYVDARVILDRLDEVLGVLGWQDEYECLPDGNVVCRLRLRLGNEWITKMDVGGPSEQPDEGDRRKAAFSDALKRAAVKFGIGRYLYRLPQQWVDYDPRTRRLLNLPSLPTPSRKKQTGEQPAEKASEKSTKMTRKTVAEQPTIKASKPSSLPADGAELQRRLQAYDQHLTKQGVCQPGELLEHVKKAGIAAGHGPDLTGWSGPAITLAVEETRVFEGKQRESLGKQKEVA